MTEQASASEPLELTWTSWPARRQPLLSIVVILFCLAVSWWAMTYMGSPWWAFLTLSALALATSEHFFPTRYCLAPQGVERRGPGQTVELPWSAFRVAEALPDRLALYRHGSTTGWLAQRRRITLRFANNADEVLQYVRRHVPLSTDKD